MKVTVAHQRSREEVKEAVDRSFDDLFKAVVGMPLQLTDEQRSWQGYKLEFSLVAKVGFLNAPIKGTVDVGERDVTIDVDLGTLEHFIPVGKIQENLGARVKGLLQ